MSDALSQILDHLRLRGSIYFHTDFHRPWGIKVPAHRNVIRFHMAVQGECLFRINGVEQNIHLGPKDLIVIPHGKSHEIADSAESQASDIEELVATFGFEASGALRSGDGLDDRPCKLVCGHFEFEKGASHPLLDALPNYALLQSGEDMENQWFEFAVRFMSSEILSGQSGSNAVVHRLAEIVFIHAIRNHVRKTGDNVGILAAILDPRISSALFRIHQQPGHAWTVHKLAALAGMSRTTFSEKFRKMVCMTPLEYVTYWRVQIAKRQLEDNRMTLAEIAFAAGYNSEAAFNRAFKRECGVTPGQLRRKSG
ncbi:AraC family transcriptional regulator [Roseobacter sp.]|uniref:AraC family transcriptional regulator n=1 Tax=Roseobacter sp. TaxID=1907202 RepID=UPI00296742BE|nr:AraC family transcriptional regulator [Roseobacter sp.]MDW3182785.1 AraC family transcriptional regulator [Roseobacter sp.]